MLSESQIAELQRAGYPIRWTQRGPHGLAMYTVDYSKVTRSYAFQVGRADLYVLQHPVLKRELYPLGKESILLSAEEMVVLNGAGACSVWRSGKLIGATHGNQRWIMLEAVKDELPFLMSVSGPYTGAFEVHLQADGGRHVYEDIGVLLLQPGVYRFVDGGGNQRPELSLERLEEKGWVSCDVHIVYNPEKGKWETNGDPFTLILSSSD